MLLVEDETAVRTLASRILRDRNYSVIEAANGQDALRLAKEHSGKIHLVLTDVIMPGIGGSVLVSQLEAARPDIKALYISGYTDNAIVHHGLLDSDIAFLQKSFSPQATGSQGSGSAGLRPKMIRIPLVCGVFILMQSGHNLFLPA